MYIFFVGLVIGALLNVVIIRLPRERRLFGWPRCTRTGEPLAVWQMLPVLGWILQRGRARGNKDAIVVAMLREMSADHTDQQIADFLNQQGRLTGRSQSLTAGDIARIRDTYDQPIPWVYPMVEILTAVTLTMLHIRYGFSPLFFYLSFVCITLIVTGAIDWTHRFIYTFVILGAVLVALLTHLLVPMPDIGLLNSAIGMAVSGVVFLAFFLLAKVLFPGTAVPFGLGDVFLGLFLGAAFGLLRLLDVLTYGIGLAGVVAAGIVFAKYVLRWKNVPKYMPYGSYLCLGAIVYLFVERW